MSLYDFDHYSPQDWGSSVDYSRWSKQDATGQLFIHWGGGPVRDPAADGNVNSEKAMLRAYEDFHLSKGWKGLAYDWAIGQSGTLYRIRGHARSAATSGDVDGDGIPNNVEGDAVLCIIGEGQAPSAEMLETLVRVIDEHPGDLYGHREGKGTKTACPGDDLMGFIEGQRSGDAPAPKKKDSKKEAPTKSSSKTDWTDSIVESLGTLKRPERSPAVRRCQALLNLSGMFSLKTDGMYGPKTERAVEEYQQHFNLTIDGICGPKTWKHLLLNKVF